MREIRQSGSEGGVALTPPSLPLSNAPRLLRRCADKAVRLADPRAISEPCELRLAR